MDGVIVLYMGNCNIFYRSVLLVLIKIYLNCLRKRELKKIIYIKCSCFSLEFIKKIKYVLKNKKVIRIDLISKELWNVGCKLGLNIFIKN